MKKALAVHLVTRLLTLAAVLVALAMHPLHTGSFGGDLGSALGKSDGVWYLAIAHHGYGSPPPIGPDGTYTHLSSLAFFPLYPLLIRVVAFTGMPYLGAALVVTLLSGCVAAVAINAWGRSLLGDRGAIVLLVAWELLPSNVVLGMAYSEALFVAAAACCLLSLQRRRWLLAGLAAGIGGLTRPTGGGLVLAVLVAIAIEVRRSSRQPGELQWWRLAGAFILGLAGLATSLIHVAVATHRVDGWFWLERTNWQSGFDGGASAVRTIGQLFSGGTAAHRFPDYVATLVVVLTLGLAVWIWRSPRRGDGPSNAYTAAVAVLALGEHGYYYVKPRLLAVGFPALVPVASWLTERSRRTLVTIGVVALSANLLYDAYQLVWWHRAL